MGFKLWLAKRLTKKIGGYKTRQKRFQYYVNCCKKWIKEDEKRLTKRLEQLSKEDFLKYSFDMGYIEKTDYNLTER